MFGKRGKKKGEATVYGLEHLSDWIIGIAVLILIITIYFILKGKGIDAIEYLKNLLRFGR